jgi:hypothetical protein
MRSRALVAVGAVLVALAFSEAASAQPVVYVEPAPAQPAPVDEAGDLRLRGAIGGEGGALIVTGAGGVFGTIGQVGVAGQLGVQINNNWAVYGVPSLDAAFGNGGAGGIFGAGVMVDYTFDDVPLALAAGPELGVLFGIGGSVAVYGGGLRITYYPVLKSSGTRRTGLFVAADARVEFLDGVFLISPLVSIGYAAF